MWFLASSLTYLLGAGGSVNDPGGSGNTVDDFPVQPALDLDGGMRVDPAIAVGVHMRLSAAHASDWDSDNDSATQWNYNLRTLDLAAAATLTRGRWFVEPWLGMHLAYVALRTTKTIFGPPDTSDNSVESFMATPLLEGGVLAGADLLGDASMRVSLFAEVQTSLASAASIRGGGSAGTEYAAFTLGAALRR